MHEYLVERLFVVTHIGEMAVLFRDLVRLDDKATWCLFSVGRQFCPTARELGHRGLCVSHYSFDRATFSALGRKFRQLHGHVHAQIARALPAHEAKLLELRDWYVSTPCGSHDAHNALKWSLHERMTDDAFLKDVHILIESLRNSYDLLVRHLGRWIVASLSFEDWGFPHQRELWTLLGLALIESTSSRSCNSASTKVVSKCLRRVRATPTCWSPFRRACCTLGAFASLRRRGGSPWATRVRPW